MTLPLAPGSRLLVDAAPLPAGSLLASANSVSNALVDEIGGTTSMVAADVKLESSWSTVADGVVIPSALVTAILPTKDNSVRTEVTAVLDLAENPAATIRLAFISANAGGNAIPGLFCPGSNEWNAELQTRLNSDTGFARLIEAYDGTLGLSVGGRPIHVRCYRGRVLEVSSRAVLGADFTLNMPSEVFIELMTAHRNSFMETAMSGHLKSEGSGYEYLRMTSALVSVIDHSRALARSAGYVGAQHTSVNTLQVA